MKRFNALLAALCLAASSVHAQDRLEDAFDQDVLVVSASSACYRFDIFLALTREQQRRGLMFVRELPSTSGMLFVYPEEMTLSIWMKNTFIPLDIVFAGADGRISSIYKDATPQSLKSMSSKEPASYVLELNAGVTDALGIGPGSVLIWEAGLASGGND